MKRYTILILWVSFFSICCYAQHPKLYVTEEERPQIIEKIKNEDWAKKAWERLLAEITPYADKHQTDPEWLVSRLAMYWKEGERYTQCYLKNENWDYGIGNAPVPTVRMPGMRTWNEYSNVPLKDRTPYNETGDMWGVSRKDPSLPPILVPYKESGHMIRGNNKEILEIASKSAFIYFIIQEEKYARMAADVYYTWLLGTYYMNPILDPDKSSGSVGGYEPGGICGYYDYEQIHDDLAITIAPAYDFLFTYLNKNPHPHLNEIGKTQKKLSEEVFRRFIDIGMVRGGNKGNWNVNGWNMMMLPILLLDSNDKYPDGKGREYYLEYYTSISTPYHDALPDIVTTYDSVTGLWPESPGYATSTVSMLVEMAIPIYKAGINTIKNTPMLQKAALAVFSWLDARGNLVVFGDSRGGAGNFVTYERLFAYYTWQRDEENAQIALNAIRKGLDNGAYDRSQSDWLGIILNVPLPEEKTEETSVTRMAYSPFHRHVVMKNGDDRETGLMATLYGGRKGHHLSANGLAMQLYGMGWALAPDASGYESYWSKDVAYHQSATGCNTIIPGYTEGEIVVNAMEPIVLEGHSINTYEISPYCSFSDFTAGEKRRLLSIVRTSPSSGYYIDIFRSDLKDNDYIYHNLGISLILSDKDENSLSLKPETLDKKYTTGYDYFENPQAIDFNKDFKAKWILPVNPDICMEMWMMGQENRTLYSVQAPYSNLNKSVSPQGISIAPHPTPTLIVRQENNNAWNKPFVAVYEPYRVGQKSIKNVTTLKQDENFVSVLVESAALNNRKEYICNAIDEEIHKTEENISFKGIYGIVSESAGEVNYLYLGYGQLLEKDNISIEADKNVSASIENQNGKWYYSSNGDIRVIINKRAYSLPPGYNLPVVE